MQAGQQRQVGCQDGPCCVSGPRELDKVGCGPSFPPKLAVCLGLDLDLGLHTIGTQKEK